MNLFNLDIQFCQGDSSKGFLVESYNFKNKKRDTLNNINNYNSHAGLIFKKFNILKFHDLVNLNQACFMYNFINNKLPISFQKFLFEIK